MKELFYKNQRTHFTKIKNSLFQRSINNILSKVVSTGSDLFPVLISCRKYLEENEARLKKKKKDFVNYAGGVNDTFVDMFGYEHEVCDVDKGWTHEAR